MKVSSRSRRPLRRKLKRAPAYLATIYLAGPDVFLPNAAAVGKRKLAICHKFGFDAIFPLNKGAEDPTDIFDINRDAMDIAQIGLFNLTPFRGPSADPGTVFELGYMYARGREKHPPYLLGYTSDTAPYRERVLVYRKRVHKDRFAIEDFKLTDNLVIVQAIGKTRIKKVPSESKKPADMLAAYEAFEACLKHLKRRAALGDFGIPRFTAAAGKSRRARPRTRSRARVSPSAKRYSAGSGNSR